MLPENSNPSENKNIEEIYTAELHVAILKLKIPEKIYLKSANEFDDKYIYTTKERWSFYYSGSQRYLIFDLDMVSNKLTQYFCFKYASTKIATSLPMLLWNWKQAINYCLKNSEFSIKVFHQYLESSDVDPRGFFAILFGIKVLCQEEFPGFCIDDYEDMHFIPRPFSHDWSIYQEIDNILSPLEKNMIVNGLFSLAASVNDRHFYDLEVIQDAVILGLSYATGARPVQLSKLAIGDIREDTRAQGHGLVRYSVLLPYAKHRHATTERLFLAIPPEIGSLLMHYIGRVNRELDDKLFEMGTSAPDYVSRTINRAILRFSPSAYQAAVTSGEAASVIITPTDFRHNVGHSLAMQGISAEEIAHILGHSSLVVAKHYILATPALALIRAKVLGVNPVWQNMIAMMLTGELVSSGKWNGKRVAGIVGGKLHAEVGGCSRADIDGECPFTEVRCCYGCLYYRPFSEGDHQSVLDSIVHEVDELLVLSDSVGCGHNPLIAVHETTQLEIQSVLTRCMHHQNSGEEQ